MSRIFLICAWILTCVACTQPKTSELKSLVQNSKTQSVQPVRVRPLHSVEGRPSIQAPLPISTAQSSIPNSHSNTNLLVVRDARLNRNVELNFIDLPAVTAEDVAQLQQDAPTYSRQTSIVPMPAFRAAEAKTSIGLYHAVMNSYPLLYQTDLQDGSQGLLSDLEIAEILIQWALNPDLPLTYTTTAEDIAFAERLSQITGRHFTVMTNSQNEYSIRGRELDADGHPTGAITSSFFYFGEVLAHVRAHGFTVGNTLTLGRAHGVHEIPEGQDALYRNTFGLIHPIGNVFSRSLDGRLRGGSFMNPDWVTESSLSLPGHENHHVPYVGSRLAEAL